MSDSRFSGNGSIPVTQFSANRFVSGFSDDQAIGSLASRLGRNEDRPTSQSQVGAPCSIESESSMATLDLDRTSSDLRRALSSVPDGRCSSELVHFCQKVDAVLHALFSQGELFRATLVRNYLDLLYGGGSGAGGSDLVVEKRVVLVLIVCLRSNTTPFPIVHAPRSVSFKAPDTLSRWRFPFFSSSGSK